MEDIRCPNKNHESKYLVSVCLNKECQFERLCCHQCEDENHSNHHSSLVDFYVINYYLRLSGNEQDSFNQEQIQVLEEIKSSFDNLQNKDQGNLEKFESHVRYSIDEYNTIYQDCDCYKIFIEEILKYCSIENNHCADLEKIQQNQQNLIEILKKLNDYIKAIIECQHFKQNQFLKFIKVPMELNYQLVQGIELSQDGTIIITFSEYGIVNLWDVQTQQLLIKIQQNQQMQEVKLSSNNVYLAIGGVKCISIYEMQNKKYNINKYWVLTSRRGLVFSQNCEFLLSEEAYRKLIIWSLALKKVIYQFEINFCVRDVIISADNRLIQCISKHPGSISIWDLQQRHQIIKEHPAHQNGKSICCSKTSSIILSTGNQVIKIWNLIHSDEEKKSTLILTNKIKSQIQDTKINKIILTEDEKYIISKCNQYGEIRVIDMQSGKEIQKLESVWRHRQQGRLIYISNNLNLLVTGSRYFDKYKIWRRK